MPSLKKNFLYNSILTTANYIFPFLTYPYVSRVLGVSNIGLVNYVDSIVQYFMLFSMLGVAIYGIREIVGAKHDKKLLSRTFSTILFINALSTLVAIAALVACIQFIPKFHEHSTLLYIGVAKLLGNLLLVEWLFKGLEDFRYITLRTLFVKCLYVVAVFVFVRDESDYFIFYILMVLMVVVNSVFNCIYARRFVRFTFNFVPMGNLIKSILILGVYMVLTNMYMTFNTAFLGYCTNDTQVGYFTTATKICLIILALFGAFTHVLLPRMSNFLKDNEYDKFKDMLAKSMRILYAFSVPLIFFSVIYADRIIYAISGPGYEGAIIPMQICMPLLLIIGYEQIIITDGLMPLKKDKAIFINSFAGAAVALFCCFTLITPLKSIGAAIVWIGSEVTVTISASYFIKKYIGQQFPWREILHSLLQYTPLALILICLKIALHMPDNILGAFTELAVAGIIILVYSFIILYHVNKEEMVVSMVNKHLKRTKSI